MSWTRVTRWMLRLLAVGFVLAIAGVGAVIYGFYHYGQDLPDYRALADYEPPIVTRVYAGNGRLIGEFAQEKRVFVPVENVPDLVKNAFLSAEDKTFYEHPGIDFMGVANAAYIYAKIKLSGSGRRPVGASTITQQVAKNFLLSNELSMERKLKEMILSFRIERTFTKDQILELYLNEIYLGRRAFGVAAAAQNYFDKALAELTVAEAAYLAALPKAPNNYRPERDYDAAVGRRNWVVDRMVEDGAITRSTAEAAKAEPLVVLQRDDAEPVGQYFVEDVRRELLDRYGEDALWGGGLVVRSTLDPSMQKVADAALREGLIAYDRRHGWRGPIARIDAEADWVTALQEVEAPDGLRPWVLAAVLEIDGKGATVGLEGGGKARIPLAEMRWAAPWREEQRTGPSPNKPSDVVAVGDVVAVEQVEKDADGEPYPEGTVALRQVPDVQGALVAMDPHTGRVLAMSGGWSFSTSEFNRATQAERQPGSAFKPFVYLAALENGYTPATIVLDAPVVVKTAGLGKYKPKNYSGNFYGPVPMRLGVEKSRNLMTLRLAMDVGIEKVEEFGERFGVSPDLPPHLSVAIGAGETTLLRLTNAYARLVNGGKEVEATLIDRVQNRYGETVFEHDKRPCGNCNGVEWRDQPTPVVPDMREQLADPLSVYQIVSIMQGVVQRGTGVRASAIGKPMGGKTGTTNDSFDTWFMGFTPDLVVGVWVGFDQPKTLGPKETGSRTALPIFIDFMSTVLEDAPATPFRVPEGIQLVRINYNTGLPAQPGDEKVIVEAFKPGNAPAPGSNQQIMPPLNYDIESGEETEAASGQVSENPGEAEGSSSSEDGEAPPLIVPPSLGSGITGTGGTY